MQNVNFGICHIYFAVPSCLTRCFARSLFYPGGENQVKETPSKARSLWHRLGESRVTVKRGVGVGVGVEAGAGARIGIYLFFFKESCFGVRVRVSVPNPNPNLNPNPNPKTAFFF